MRQLSMLYGIEFDRHDIISRQKFVDQGMRIHQLDPKEMERWRAAVEPLWEEFIQENEAKGLPARQLVADLRALVKKYESWTVDQLMKEVVENPVRGIIDGM
jgi:ribosomal protein S13